MAGNSSRRGAVSQRKKKVSPGSGGNNRRRLAGKGPTPKAEDRTYHKASKRKAATPTRRSAPRGRMKNVGEVVAGRNSVLEALESQVKSKELLIVHRLDGDDRTRSIIGIAMDSKIPIREVTRDELDGITERAVHQGVALILHEYQYADGAELLVSALKQNKKPLLVALDGITDPRNLGAIIRSAAAFGAQGVIITERRSAGMTAAAWKSSAGAAARVPVGKITNLVSWLKEAKKSGYFVAGLDAAGDSTLSNFKAANDALVIVVGSEGKGISRLVSETCDFLIAIPMDNSTESLNAGIAASIAMYSISQARD